MELSPAVQITESSVNKDGMGRWKPYAKNLKPLLESLDKNLLTSEDISIIK